VRERKKEIKRHSFESDSKVRERARERERGGEWDFVFCEGRIHPSSDT
jgi:hypothetical protein